MNITQIQVKKIYNDPTKPVKAKVSVVVDNEMLLNNIRIIEKVDTQGVKKKFLSFPSLRISTIDENNNPQYGFQDIFHPINDATRLKFTQAIFEAVDQYKENLNNDKDYVVKEEVKKEKDVEDETN